MSSDKISQNIKDKDCAVISAKFTYETITQRGKLDTSYFFWHLSLKQSEREREDKNWQKEEDLHQKAKGPTQTHAGSRTKSQNVSHYSSALQLSTPDHAVTDFLFNPFFPDARTEATSKSH